MTFTYLISNAQIGSNYWIHWWSKMPRIKAKCNITQSNPEYCSKIGAWDQKTWNHKYECNWVHLQVISQLLLIRIYFVLIMFIIENILDHHSKDVNMNQLFSRCAYQTMMNHQFEITRILSEKSWLWYFDSENFKISVESKSKRAQCLEQWTFNILRFQLKKSNLIF